MFSSWKKRWGFYRVATNIYIDLLNNTEKGCSRSKFPCFQFVCWACLLGMLCQVISCLCQMNLELIQSPMHLECWVCWQLAGVGEKIGFICCSEQWSCSSVYSPHSNCISSGSFWPTKWCWVIRLWLMALDVRGFFFFLFFLRMVTVWHLCRTNYLLVHQARSFVLHSVVIARFALGLLC